PFSPAGNLLASAGSASTTRLWDPVSGTQRVTAPGYFLRFSADGRRLGFINADTATLGIWEVAGGRVCRRLHHGRVGNQSRGAKLSGPFAVDFSDDGGLLVSSGGDGIRLWDTATAEVKAHLAVGPLGPALFDHQSERILREPQA